MKRRRYIGHVRFKETSEKIFKESCIIRSWNHPSCLSQVLVNNKKEKNNYNTSSAMKGQTKKNRRKFLKIKHKYRFFYTSNFICKHGSYQKQATFLFPWPPELYTRSSSSQKKNGKARQNVREHHHLADTCQLANTACINTAVHL